MQALWWFMHKYFLMHYVLNCFAQVIWQDKACYISYKQESIKEFKCREVNNIVIEFLKDITQSSYITIVKYSKQNQRYRVSTNWNGYISYVLHLLSLKDYKF